MKIINKDKILNRAIKIEFSTKSLYRWRMILNYMRATSLRNYDQSKYDYQSIQQKVHGIYIARAYKICHNQLIKSDEKMAGMQLTPFGVR